MGKDDVQQNRLWNFRQIISAAGGTNEVARIMKKSNSQITQIGGPNPSRNIGNRVAAKIETAFGLPPGSLDTAPPRQAKNDDAYLSKICAALANASDTDKEFVLAMSEWIVSRRMKLPTQQTGVLIDAKDIAPVK